MYLLTFATNIPEQIKTFRFCGQEGKEYRSPSIATVAPMTCQLTITHLKYIYIYIAYLNIKIIDSVPVAQWLEHCVSSAKVVGSIPREH